MTIRLLLADDHSAVRAGLRVLLDDADDIEIVGEAGNGVEAVELAEVLRPDVVLMDVQMPRMTGVEATSAIVSGDDPPRVIVLTTFAIDQYVDEALAAGASAFLLKTVSSGALVDAIRRVHDGEAVLAPEVTRRVIDRLTAAPSAHQPAAREPLAAQTARFPGLDDLTPREREVLALVGDGLSNADVAKSLVLSEATARTHVSRVLAKLGVASRVQAAIIAHRAGVVRDSPAQPPA
ncbi:response regulator [Plantibacter sp. Mn2098]|uniref:response regulator n=1 Tax=Plantibacter sp. Mn2098 TaxID=3395266 RepID=UPI003BECF079